ncbi:MAG: hypothetical protein DMF84_03570 [Acidobacteria bacterium]|nr:MAG: hypothetical protein DMF84_03570 [Acidobacteriota bacterium]
MTVTLPETGNSDCHRFRRLGTVTVTVSEPQLSDYGTKCECPRFKSGP